jgi:hypothetical protein
MYKFCEREIALRLQDWSEFRNYLEICDNPYTEVHQYFQKLPKVKVYTDPYNQNTWPTPWQLIEENFYCPFNIILGICYTLQLTERFSKVFPTISIAVDKSNKTVYYLLYFKDKIYGYSDDGWIPAISLPKTLKVLKIYSMKSL